MIKETKKLLSKVVSAFFYTADTIKLSWQKQNISKILVV
jgi:hypothetical protein